MKEKVPKDRWGEIKAMIRSGATLQSVADTYGITRQRVHQMCRDMKIRARSREISKAKMCKRYRSGLSIAEIAGEFGLHVNTVANHIKSGTGSKPSRNYYNISKRDDWIEKLFLSGKTRVEITEMSGLSQNHVSRILISRGHRDRIRITRSQMTALSEGKEKI